MAARPMAGSGHPSLSVAPNGLAPDQLPFVISDRIDLGMRRPALTVCIGVQLGRPGSTPLGTVRSEDSIRGLASVATLTSTPNSRSTFN